MKKLTIQPGCITCGSCEFYAPEVFEVTDISHVKENADLETHKEAIKKAARACPMQIIKFKEIEDEGA